MAIYGRIVSNKIIFDLKNFKFTLIQNHKSVLFVELKRSIVLDSEITVLELPCYGNYVSKRRKDKIFFFLTIYATHKLKRRQAF